MPLVEALKKYIDGGVIPMHMPGHKQGKGLSDDFIKDLVKMDLTEVPGLDNLHFPKGAIYEAERLLSEAYGSKYSYFVVNGSTGSNYAMMLSALKPGDKVVMMRNSHKSAYNALILAGAEAVYLYPEYVKEYQIAAGLNYDGFIKTLDDHPDAKAVFVTSPDYYGFCIDISKIAYEAHKRDMLLLVDEAHGAHFHFSGKLPDDALKQGADMVSQSPHKTLTAFTQSSYLHINTDKVDESRVKDALRLVQSTSPSYMLMASLDYTRALMQGKGAAMLDEAIDLSAKLRDGIRKYGISCPGSEFGKRYGIIDHDPMKIFISMDKRGIEGHEVERILRRDYGIQLEMSDAHNALAMITLSDDKSSVKKLEDSVISLYNNSSAGEKTIKSGCEINKLKNKNKGRMNLRDAYFADKICANLDDAAGEICGDFIVPYPPGIPIVCPGEILMKQDIDDIKNRKNVQGVEKGFIRIIKR